MKNHRTSGTCFQPEVPEISVSLTSAMPSSLIARELVFTVILPSEFPVGMLSTWVDVHHKTWVLYREDTSWGARYTCTGP